MCFPTHCASYCAPCQPLLIFWMDSISTSQDDQEYAQCCGFGGGCLRSGDGGEEDEQRQHRCAAHCHLLRVVGAKGNAWGARSLRSNEGISANKGRNSKVDCQLLSKVDRHLRPSTFTIRSAIAGCLTLPPCSPSVSASPVFRTWVRRRLTPSSRDSTQEWRALAPLLPEISELLTSLTHLTLGCETESFSTLSETVHPPPPPQRGSHPSPHGLLTFSEPTLSPFPIATQQERGCPFPGDGGVRTSVSFL